VRDNDDTEMHVYINYVSCNLLQEILKEAEKDEDKGTFSSAMFSLQRCLD